MMRTAQLGGVGLGPKRSVLCLAAIMVVLGCGPVAAFGAAPAVSEPAVAPKPAPPKPTVSNVADLAVLDSLPKEVAGVVGSGDQLSLRLKSADGQVRTLKIGDEYKSGWVLRRLTDAVAILSKGSELHPVGLNPDGQLGSAAAEQRSRIMVLGALTDDQITAAVKAEIASGRWNGKPAWGLTQEQTNRMVAYDVQRDSVYVDWYSKNWAAGQLAGEIPSRPTEADIFGANNDEYQSLNALRTQYRIDNFQADNAGPLSGPSSVYVPVDQIPGQAVVAAGGDPSGTWVLGAADANGGRTMTRVPTPTYAGGSFTSAMSVGSRGTDR